LAYHRLMIGGRASGLWNWAVRVYRQVNHPVTHKQAWLVSAAMLLPTAGFLYGLTAIGRVLLGTPIPSLTFLATFPIYVCAVTGAVSSWKINRG
jgi:hypothetical protein